MSDPQTELAEYKTDMGSTDKEMEMMNLNRIVEDAIAAGRRAHEAEIPTPMTVVDGAKTYHVSEGLCGFAWVKVYGVRSNSKIGKALQVHGFKKSSTGGLQYRVSTMTQSVARKEAFASAMAKVLNDNGIKACADSRLD